VLKRVYVWELPVRLTHWLNFLTIIVLCFTGYYISHPFIDEPRGAFCSCPPCGSFILWPPTYSRSAFSCGSTGLRGESVCPVGRICALDPEGLEEILGDIKFYLFLQKEHAHRTGHHALASFTYLGMFILFHLMIVTGFALLSQFHHGPVWKILGGWLVPFVSFQTLRLIHHLLMWLFIAFAILMFYAGWVY